MQYRCDACRVIFDEAFDRCPECDVPDQFYEFEPDTPTPNFANLRCPKCGDTERIDITAKVFLRCTPDGTDPWAAGDNDHEWDNDSPAICRGCSYAASVATFCGPTLKLVYSTGNGNGTVERADFLNANQEHDDGTLAEIEEAIAKGETYRLAIHAGLFVDISKA